jgi:hypothetical protein
MGEESRFSALFPLMPATFKEAVTLSADNPVFQKRDHTVAFRTQMCKLKFTAQLEDPALGLHPL